MKTFTTHRGQFKGLLLILHNVRRRLAAMSGSVRLLVGAFALIWLLMAGIGLMGLYALENNNRRMEQIVREHNRKLALVTALGGITRERALAVHEMILSSDPFVRDELMLHFRELASDYIQQMNQLRALPLAPEEVAAIQASQDKIRASTRLMERVVTLALDGRDAEAKALLMDRAIPAQDQVQAYFAEFSAYQARSTEAALRAARAAYQRAYRVTGLLGGSALILGLLMSALVIRRTAGAERALAREKERAEVTLHSIGDAVITTDASGHIDHLNSTAERLTGWTNAEAQGRMVEEIYRLMDEDNIATLPIHPVTASLLSSMIVEPSLKAPLLRARDGKEYAIEQTVSPILNTEKKVIGIVVVFRDVTTERSLTNELAWQASHDALTGLANRHEFERRLQELVDSARAQRISHVLLFMDLDQFKLVNDTCGHVAGDELLRQLSTLLTAKIRAVDTLARLGGDEFGLLLPGCNVEQGKTIAEKLRQEIAEFRFSWGAKTFSIGVSVGLVEIMHESESLASLLSAADTACYMAKDRGRNRVCVHQAQDVEVRRLYGEAEWVNRITRAFEENRFRLYYQKIQPLRPLQYAENREILLRMIDEKGELVPPMAFIPAAERYNLMPTIDRWVVRTLLAWMKPNLSVLPADANIAINLSGQSLGDDSFGDFVQEQLLRSGIAPNRICFEITETAAIANLSHALRLMSGLRAMGCHFSLDDFGSGMSSFAYLKNLPVDSIKIDGAFVRDMLNDPTDFAMVEAIARIGHVMGLKTIAEYVESEAIMHRLDELGVDFVQGFGIHRPEPLIP